MVNPIFLSEERWKGELVMAGLFARLFSKKSAAKRQFCSAVVVAAGSSARMGGEDKLMLALGGEPVIVHSVRALQLSPWIDEIVLVTRSESVVSLSNLCRAYAFSKVTKVLVGGATRTLSVRIGTLEVSDKAELIAIHDGARPLVTQQVIERVVQRAAQCAAAAPAVPVKDTLKQAMDGLVIDTPDRAQFFAVQTPQVFQASLIKAALHKAIEEHAQLTDDCAAVERLGMSVALTEGDSMNLKITTPSDLWAAQGILAAREVF